MNQAKNMFYAYSILTILADLGAGVDTYRTRYVKTGYFFDTNTKELQNSRQLSKQVIFLTQTQSNFKTVDSYENHHKRESRSDENLYLLG